jgi:hypothetical protein
MRLMRLMRTLPPRVFPDMNRRGIKSGIAGFLNRKPQQVACSRPQSWL